MDQGGAIASNHLVFTSLNGETVSVSTSGSTIEIVYAAGEVKSRMLPDGTMLETISVRPGVCASDPSNITAATGGTATGHFSAQGILLDSTQTGSFSAVEGALSCKASAIRADFRAFAGESGLPINSHLNGTSPVIPGGIGAGRAHTLTSEACQEATEAALIAEAVAVISIGDPVALIAAAVAVLHQHQVCNDNP